MAVLQGLLYALFVFLTASPLAYALKFDLAAHMGNEHKYERCIRNFVGKDTLVLVTAIVDGFKGDGQVVNMHVRPWKARICRCHASSEPPAKILTSHQIKDAVGNEYGRPKDIVGETRMAFTSHADAAFDVCFENKLTAQRMH